MFLVSISIYGFMQESALLLYVVHLKKIGVIYLMRISKQVLNFTREFQNSLHSRNTVSSHQYQILVSVKTLFLRHFCLLFSETTVLVKKIPFGDEDSI